MNERIKELAKQLGYNVNFKPSTDEVDRSYQVVSNDFAEKFAELIVRECILTIQMGITRDGTTTEKFKRSMTHIKDIKQHFGVEE